MLTTPPHPCQPLPLSSLPPIFFLHSTTKSKRDKSTSVENSPLSQLTSFPFYLLPCGFPVDHSTVAVSLSLYTMRLGVVNPGCLKMTPIPNCMAHIIPLARCSSRDHDPRPSSFYSIRKSRIPQLLTVLLASVSTTDSPRTSVLSSIRPRRAFCSSSSFHVNISIF